MALDFVHPRPATTASVQAMEARLGTHLPTPLRKLLTTVSNGGAVEPAILTSDPDVGIVAVLGAERHDSLDLEMRLSEYPSDRLPAGLLPILDAEGGNLVCVSVRAHDFGTVWFWDHEREPLGDPVRMLASDLDQFLAELSPAATLENTIEATDFWIDPTLLSAVRDESD